MGLLVQRIDPIAADEEAGAVEGASFDGEGHLISLMVWAKPMLVAFARGGIWLICWRSTCKRLDSAAIAASSGRPDGISVRRPSRLSLSLTRGADNTRYFRAPMQISHEQT
jgi:hypothetical protein